MDLLLRLKEIVCKFSTVNYSINEKSSFVWFQDDTLVSSLGNIRALGKPGYTSTRAAVKVGMNGGSPVRSGTESMGCGPGSEKQHSGLQADAYRQGKLPPPTLGNAQGTRGI